MRTTPEGPSALLERGTELARLTELRDAVAKTGLGQVVLIGGEAGVGKTSLVRSVVADSDMRCLAGACDPLFTPRPLGPLLDIAETVSGDLETIIAAGTTPHEVATILLHDLRDHDATVIVLEDLHWADEATLDVFGILAHRIRSVPALVLVTYRDEELGEGQPLRIVLGGLATSDGITRIAVSPLSAEAVATLAAPIGVNALELHRTTGGNPFYVTEVLASGTDEIPPTIRDAVHARVARLTPDAKELLQAAAVLPPPVELRLLEAVGGDSIAALPELLTTGLLNEDAQRMAFRHELARLAIEEELPPNRRVALHRAALAAQQDDAAPDLARLAHHAEAAGDTDAVLRFAPAAAERAASVGAHREAAAQYERALRFGDALPPGDRAALLAACARQSRTIGEFRRGIELWREAAGEHERVGDLRKQARALCQMAGLIWAIGSSDEASAVVQDALAILEADPEAPERLVAFERLCAVAWGQLDRDEVVELARRATELAERIDRAVPPLVRIYAACSDFARDSESARAEIEQTVADAVAAGRENAAGFGYGLLALVAVRTRRHDLAESYIRRGLDYCIERDLGDTPFTEAWRAALDAQRGRWPQAEDTAELVLSRGGVGLATAVTLTTFARLLVRQGREGRHEALEAARERAERSGELWLLAPIASVLAEAAWLEGRAHDVSGLTQPAWEASSTRGEVWVTAELAAWRKRAGLVDPIDESTPEPYASELAGDALGAAALWDKLGCPYEAALARADSDNEKAQRLALDQLRELGAEPAATIVARRLRSRGAKGLPRGPRPSTRENPAGLTSREVEVLTLVAEGLRNGDIAQRLFLSEKTVSHHVSAILHKLDVKTRGEAGAAAVRLGLARDDA